MPKSARKRQEQLAKKRKKRDKLKKARILASKNVMKNHVANESMATYSGAYQPVADMQGDAVFGDMSKMDLREKVQSILGDKVQVVEHSKKYNHRKLSEILWEYILEVEELPDDFSLAMRMVTLFVSAWNVASALSRTDYDVDLETSVYEKVGFQYMDDNLKKVFCDLVKKKRLCYPDDNRFIVEFVLTEMPQGYHLNVASLMFE